MHIVVLGAGIIGITTAYQLLKDGHNVTVIERETGPAQFTSFANAGLVAPGHAYAWGSPAAPGMMWRSFFAISVKCWPNTLEKYGNHRQKNSNTVV